MTATRAMNMKASCFANEIIASSRRESIAQDGEKNCLVGSMVRIPFSVTNHLLLCSDKPLTTHQESVQALGKHYHAGHLQCYHCRQPINPKTTGLVEHQGHVFCREDFKHLFLPKCRSCGLPVEKEAVSALDGKLQGKWHRNCFGCQVTYRVEQV